MGTRTPAGLCLWLVRGGVCPGDVSLGAAAAQPVLVEAAGRFAATVEARDHLALHVQYLALRVDPKTSPGIVHERRSPGGVERRRLNLVPGPGLAKIHVRTGIHK